jgi:uncharacterized protein (TIGR02646 family)
MRTIHKQGNEPNELEQRRNSTTPFGWEELNDDDLKDDVQDALLSEQGFICAYTGIRIDKDKSHIEHLKPRSHDWNGDTDVRYDNMVACYPKEGGCPFGAMHKGSWPSPAEWEDFITPLEDRCAHCFRYGTNGSVRAVGDLDAAKKTIDKLNLDHPELQNLRRDAIEGVLESFDQTNPQALRAAIRKRMEQLRRSMRRESPNRLAPFVFALVDALETYLQ